MPSSVTVADEPTPNESAPLNRKYRPQSFDSAELVGQDHIVRTLRNAIRSNRIAQAYLFCGPRGTGKTSTARILAKAANCLDPDPDNRPCNHCTSCLAINNGATPDVIEIDAASNRGIDDIRDLRERVNYAPTQLRTKFYIIDEAHQITGAAANAFLKTLEEPPSHTKFILATTDPEELLPTIVSRCQRFDFKRHTIEGIALRISRLAEREGIRLAQDAVKLVAQLAHGSLRDPIGLLDQLANYQSASGGAGDEITAEDVRDLVGMSGSDVAIRILQAVAELNSARGLTEINSAVSSGQDPRQLNRQLVALIREGIYAASGVPPVGDDIGISDLAERLGLEGFLRIARTFSDTESKIRSAVIPQMPLELSILQAIVDLGGSSQVAAPVRTEPVSERPPDPRPHQSKSVAAESAPTFDPEPAPPRTRLQDQVRQRAPVPTIQDSPTPQPSPQPEPEPLSQPAADVGDPAPTHVSVEILVEMWPKIRADIKSLDRRTEALLMEIDPVEVSDTGVILASPYEFHRNMLNEEERRSILESVIARRVGRSYRVTCVLRSELTAFQPSRSAPQAAAPPLVTATTPVARTTDVSVENGSNDSEPVDSKVLGAVLRMFDGEIVESPEE